MVQIIHNTYSQAKHQTLHKQNKISEYINMHTIATSQNNKFHNLQIPSNNQYNQRSK